MPKTTKKHFDLFVSESRKWIDIFGLKAQEIHFKHEDVGNGNIAMCRRDSVARVAKLSLCKTWPVRFIMDLSDENVKLAAFEEVCHIFLYELSSCAYSRFIMEHEIDESEHSIIRTLQSVLYPKY